MTKMNFKRATVAMLTSAMLAGAFTSGAPYSVKAATEHWNDASEEASKWTTWKDNWETFSSNYENVSLTPGVDETELNFAYYSHTQEIPKVKLAVNADMSDAVEFTGTQETGVVISDQQYYSNKITAKDLKENTQYYYQVWQNGEWSQVEEYSTKSFSEFSFNKNELIDFISSFGNISSSLIKICLILSQTFFHVNFLDNSKFLFY